MLNLAMHRKLTNEAALDVRVVGELVFDDDICLDDGARIFRLAKFVEDVDYCDAESESWVWSIGRRESDGAIFAALDTRFYQQEGFECLWLR